MLVSQIANLKSILEATLHLSRDALHVHIGLLVFLACAALLRNERRFLLAFLMLLGLCLLGEASDLAFALRSGHWHGWLASVKDIVNTMFWPGVWLLAGPTIQRRLKAGRGASGARVINCVPQEPAR